MTSASQWPGRDLGEVVTLQRGFDLPAKHRRPGPFPVLTSGEGGGSHAEGPVSGPGVTIGRATNLGQPKWSEGDFWPHNTTLFVKDFHGNHPRWVFHLFESLDLSGYDSGSVQPMLNRNYVAKVQVRVPPRDVQRAIAEVLGALDDKIAANRALLETLNELPDVLFRQLTHSVADSVPLLEVADVVKGVSYRSAGLVDDSDTALVTLKSVSRDGRFVARGFKPYSGDYRAAQEVHVGDTIVAQTDLTQGAEVVGWAVRVPDVHDYATLVATLDLAIIRPRDDCPSEFILGALRQPQFRNHCRAMVSGTTVLHLAKDAFPAYGVPKLDRAVAGQYAEEVRGLHRLGDAVARESERLTKTRDALLPLLMSGRVTVKDAESVVEGVA